MANTKPIVVYVPADGGFIAMATTATGDGGFTVSGVPAGEVYVQFAPSNYLVTSERVLNLDDRQLGRPNTPQAAPPVAVSTSLSGLEPTEDLDVWIVTPNTGFYANFWFLNAPFTPLVTSVSNEPATFDSPMGGLPDGVAGDSTWVLQFVDRNPGVAIDAGFAFYRSVEKSVQLMGLTIAADGGSLTAALSTPSARIKQASTLRAGEFAALGNAVHPAATVGPVDFSVYQTPTPVGAVAGWVGFSGYLLSYYASPSPAVDLPFVLEFADPFPPTGWSKVYSYSVGFRVPTLLTGTTIGRWSAYITETYPQVQAVVVPRLSPPAALTVNGQAASLPMSLSSRQLTVAWSPPALGVADQYSVRIYRLTKSGNTTTRSLVTRVLTQGLSVRLPQALEPGANYFVVVTAFSAPGYDLRTTPLAFSWAMDTSSADTVSSVLTTP